jgi:GNAT superfamily N-acetyltransferase
MKELSIDRASTHEAELICSNLRAFNRDSIGEISFSPIQLVVRDPAGQLRGGAIAEVALGWLEVVVLWVDGHARGRGIGSRLLSVCEENAVLLGAHSARLDTFDWQALDFYSKRGYAVFGELGDYPQGRKRYFMSKSLLPPNNSVRKPPSTPRTNRSCL